MKEKQVPHKYIHLIVLGIVMGLSLFTFFLLMGKKELQFMVGFMAAVSYILWGIIYHLIEHDLYLRIVIEYILVATVGLVLLYTVLFV